MQQFVEYIVKNLVDDPSAVKVNCQRQGDKAWLLEMHVAKEDIGKVVGRGGQTIKALRLLSMVVSSRVGQRVQLQLIEEK